MNSVEFLTELWGETPPGFVLLWWLQGKRSAYIERPVTLLPARGEPDLYTGVGLAHKDHGAQRRTKNADVCAIAGLWADIDINGGPDNKTGANETLDQAIETAQLLAEPTIIVSSGYGLQAWWLFEDGPWRFANLAEQQQAARAAAQWQKLLRDQGGHGLDYTHDLARVLRLPGTTNAKGGQSKIVAVLGQGPRHARDELLEIASAAGEISTGSSTSAVGPVAVRTPQGGLIAGLTARSPRFARTWRHERDELGSMSEIDLSLASIAALAGCTDQQIADVIAAHRAAHDDVKGARVDYLRRTVAKARSVPEVPPELLVEAKRGSYSPGEWATAIRESLTADRSRAVPGPFRALNIAMHGGLAPGDVALIAAYTSHGKSILVDMWADTAAAAGKSVHLYLTEMTAAQRGFRLLSRRTGISFRKFRLADELTRADWALIDAELALLPYGVSVVSDWSVQDVVADILASRRDLCVVDLIHGFDYTDERDLSRTSSEIVRAAKASDSAILCAAHLNDGQVRDQRSAKRPMPGLASIKGASSLKQDADVVIFVWREDSEDGTPKEDGEAAVWIAKNRNGALIKVSVRLDPASMTFKEELRAA